MKKIAEIGSSLTGVASITWRVFQMLWPTQKKIFTAFIMLAVVFSFLPFVLSGGQAVLINELLANGTHGLTVKIVMLAILMKGSGFFQDIFRAFQTFLDKRIWMNINEFFEMLMLRKRIEIDFARYENPAFQDLLTKATDRGISPLCQLVDKLFQQITNVLQMAMASVIFLTFDWRICLLVAVGSLPDFFVQLKYGNTSWGIWDTDSQTRRKYQSVRRHFFGSSLMELKIYQNAEKFYGLVHEMYRNFDNKQRALESKALRWRLAASGITVVLQGLVYLWIIWQVSNGWMRLGTMTFLVSSMGRFEGALNGFFNSVAQQFEHVLYAKDVFKVLDTKPIIESKEGAILIACDTPPTIEFRDVSFAYPDTENLILRNVNLTIRPGERLAIVGVNGAGKSTLIKLLMRFYDPTGGAILINGIDLRQIDKETWWSVVAALFQDYAYYQLPVREIISLGRSNGKGFLTKVVRAAKAVEAHSFIRSFSHRYDQMIGKEFDGGTELSKGQSQKIALARCLYRAGQVMILDEPTASMDAGAEATVFQQLQQSVGNCTQIVISHRFSTVRLADRICVLEDGKVSELGSHDELMANGQTYSELFRLQAKGYE